MRLPYQTHRDPNGRLTTETFTPFFKYGMKVALDAVASKDRVMLRRERRRLVKLNQEVLAVVAVTYPNSY